MGLKERNLSHFAIEYWTKQNISIWTSEPMTIVNTFAGFDRSAK